MFEFFLQLSISKQIQLGVTIVIIISIILFQLLILIAIFIQMNYILTFFYALIENEENSLMRNFNVMLEKHQSLVIEKAKSDAQLLNLYANNLLHNDDVIDYFDKDKVGNIIQSHTQSDPPLNQLANDQHYYVKKFNENNKEVSVAVLLESVLNDIIKKEQSLFDGYKLYTRENVFCYSKKVDIDSKANQCSIELDEISNNEALDTIIASNANESIDFIKKVIFELNSSNDQVYACNQYKTVIEKNPLLNLNRNKPYQSSVKSMSYSKSHTDEKCQLNDLDSVIQDFNYLIDLQLNQHYLVEAFTEIIPFLSNGLFLITNPNENNTLLTTDSCQYLNKYSNLSNTTLEEPITFDKCFSNSDKKFNDSLPNLSLNLNLSEDYSFFIQDFQSTGNKSVDFNSDYYFKMSKVHFPSNSSSILSSVYLLSDINFTNYLIYNNNRRYSHENTVFRICLRYFIIIALFNYILWAILLIYIFIRVLFISWKISKPIDDLIQSISQNNSIDNQAQDDLKKKLAKISYKDDYIINELFMLCKKLIIGGFKQFAEQQKKRMKMMNANEANGNMMSSDKNSLGRGEDEKKKDYFAKIDEESSVDSFESNATITIGSNKEEDEEISMKTPNQMEIKHSNVILPKVSFQPVERNGHNQHGYLSLFPNENHFLCGYSFKKIFLNHEDQISQDSDYYTILKSLGEGVVLPKVNENDKGSPRRTQFRP